MNKKQICQNVVLYSEPTKKFKDISLAIRWFLPLDERSMSLASLLVGIMNDRSIKYPTKQLMDAKTDWLYGSAFSVRTAKTGATLMIETKAKCVEDQFVNHPVFAELMEFLSEILLHPLINEETFEESKKLALQAVAREKESPVKYAIRQAFSQGYAQQPIAISERGSANHLEKATLKDIKHFHHKLIDESRWEFFVVGNVEEAKVLESIRQNFKPYDRLLDLQVYYQAQKTSKEDIHESLKISQSTLIKVASVNTVPTKKQYVALRLANCLFGETPNSVLFQEVREKRSLCYSISSGLLPYDGLLMVMTSLADETIEETSQLIDDLLDQLKHQPIDETLFKDSKVALIDRYLSIQDDGFSLIDYQLRNNSLGINQSPEEMIEVIESITPQDVRESLQTIKFSYNYLLRGNEVVNEQD